jgi:hypothetical protein
MNALLQALHGGKTVVVRGFRNRSWAARSHAMGWRRRFLARLLGPHAERLLRSFLAQHSTAPTSEVYAFISTIATALGGGSELTPRLRGAADAAAREGEWNAHDVLSIEDRTKKAEAELRAWMEEHPGLDPRDESIIEEIAESWVPIYNYERLRVAMESSLWLIAGDIDSEAHSAAEMLGQAMYEWIRDALYELAEAEHAEEDIYEPQSL